MLTIGASHRTATSAMLGDFSRAAHAFRTGLAEGRLGRDVPVHELAVLATCARVEVYAVPLGSSAEEAAGIVGREVFGSAGDSDTDGTLYRYRGPEAVRHLCRVAAGLESFVIGEHEIAGQVLRALKDAVRVRGGSNELQGVAVVARRASRRVRTETGIGRLAASVSSVAVDLAREQLGDLSGRRAVVVGAGRAGLLVARTLRSSGIGSLTVVNRSLDRARDVAAEVGGDFAGLAGLTELLADADFVIAATGAESVIVDVATAEQALQMRAAKRPPLLLIDLALPGDVAPEVASLGGLELLTLEDVKARVQRHLSLRRGELGAAERAVDEVVDEFLRAQDAPDVEALIGELRRSIEEVRSAEVGRWLETYGSHGPPSREDLDKLTRAIVNKVLHDSMKRLRAERRRSGKGRLMVRAARELVGLNADSRTEPTPQEG